MSPDNSEEVANGGLSHRHISDSVYSKHDGSEFMLCVAYVAYYTVPKFCVVLDIKQEVIMNKAPGERLGLSITGGAGTPCGNVVDITDEGIFISRVCLHVSLESKKMTAVTVKYIQ